MSEQRFVVGSNEIGEIIVTDVETGNVYRYGDISKFFGLIRLLNEQQDTIEHLTKSRDKWRELSNSFSFYCKCYEKAIERAFEEKPYPTEDDINRIYAELEKELEYE